MLFKPFSQTDASTTRKYGGTGLGLVISKELCTKMGGRIEVECKYGQGTKFWFTAQFEKGARETREPLDVPASLKGTRVLILDDNATNRTLLSILLASWEIEVEEAASGPHALQKLHAARKTGRSFHIALIDMQLPHMDGEMVGRKVMEDPDLNHTKLVMITSLGIRRDSARAKEIGFSAYLTKPIRQDLLLRCLVNLAQDSSPQPAEKEAPIMTKYSLAGAGSSGKRILVVEDNVVNQRVVVKFPHKAGYKAELAANGQEALSALRLISFDLVLMDVQMPVMDGFEATRQIRAPESAVLNRAVPIIALTANAMKGDREKCIQAGMDGYVTKPINLEQLIQALDKHLGSQAKTLQ
jgi:CheY-like chemotaxis protein